MNLAVKEIMTAVYRRCPSKALCEDHQVNQCAVSGLRKLIDATTSGYAVSDTRINWPVPRGDARRYYCSHGVRSTFSAGKYLSSHYNMREELA